jgi:hypothetical protein
MRPTRLTLLAFSFCLAVLATACGGGAGGDQAGGAIDSAAKAQDLQAQMSLRTAQGAAVALYSEGGDFAGAGVAQMQIMEPSLTYMAGSSPSASVNSVSVHAEAGVWAAAVLSESGTCWYLKLAGPAQPMFGRGSTCTGDAAAKGAATPGDFPA